MADDENPKVFLKFADTANARRLPIDKPVADQLFEALVWFESGRTEAGVAALRRLLVGAGYKLPPPRSR